MANFYCYRTTSRCERELKLGQSTMQVKNKPVAIVKKPPNKNAEQPVTVVP